MKSKENATVLRKALRTAFGARNVSVKIGTGTARSWLHTEVKVERAFDCLSPSDCNRKDAPCKMCLDKYNSAKHRFDSVMCYLKETNKIEIPTFSSDDGIGPELDCHQISVKLV